MNHVSQALRLAEICTTMPRGSMYTKSEFLCQNSWKRLARTSSSGTVIYPSQRFRNRLKRYPRTTLCTYLLSNRRNGAPVSRRSLRPPVIEVVSWGYALEVLRSARFRREFNCETSRRTKCLF